jgi:plasmid stability protein
MPFNFEEIAYNAKAGRYVRADGKFVGKEVIRNLVDQEQQRLQVRLQAHTRLMANQTITLAEWQLRMAESLRDSHLRAGTLGAGGKARTEAQHFGAIGYQLRRQYQYLDGFAQALHEGKLTREQALRRAAMYADSMNTTFHRAEQISREREGFDQALRSLDSSSKHCTQCLAHSTYGEWKPVALVVSPGTDCACQAHCRCSIAYRRSSRPKPTILNRGTLAA